MHGCTFDASNSPLTEHQLWGQPRTRGRVRGDGAFFRSCRRVRGTVAAPTAVQPGLLLSSELGPIADVRAGGCDESYEPAADSCGPRTLAAVGESGFHAASNRTVHFSDAMQRTN